MVFTMLETGGYVRKQTRARIIREKTATLSLLIDAYLKCTRYKSKYPLFSLTSLRFQANIGVCNISLIRHILSY